MASQEKIEAATSKFMQDRPDFSAYDTDHNWGILGAYVEQTWGADSNAVENPSCYEIAFLACKDDLKPIEGYVFISDEFREALKLMPQSQVKERYREPEFKRLYDAIALEEFDSSGARIPSTPYDPWKYLTAEEWVRIDATKRANLYAHEPLFRAAVQKLIDEGSI